MAADFCSVYVIRDQAPGSVAVSDGRIHDVRVVQLDIFEKRQSSPVCTVIVNARYAVELAQAILRKAGAEEAALELVNAALRKAKGDTHGA